MGQFFFSSILNGFLLRFGPQASILILLPFRFSALDWFRAITSRTPPNFQIEHQSRFLSEYGLPIGAVDKLAEPGTYPPDHLDTYQTLVSRSTVSKNTYTPNIKIS
jgi:hypothetical protein